MEGTPEVRLRHAMHHQHATGGSTTTGAPLEVYLPPVNGTTNSTSELDSEEQSGNEFETTKLVLYQCVAPFLILFCIASLLVNIRILVSVFWIKRPLSSTLHISLSLAGADAFTSFLLGLGLAINSLLRPVLKIDVGTCFLLTLEALRLGGIIITVFHLLALAGNHYLGIRKPMHSRSIMTRRHTTACIVALWVLPITYFFAYFSLVHQQGFQAKDCVSSFLVQYKFRVIFSSLFFGPFPFIFMIYTHIFFIVRRLQKERLSMFPYSTTGSQFRPCQQQQHDNDSRSPPSLHNQEQQQQQQRKLEQKVKTIKTTLFILGSYVMGWMPAITVFLLVCEDCHYPLETSKNTLMFSIHVFCNFLIILKTMANPIIYAAHMKDIKLARELMYSSIRRECCPCLGPRPRPSHERDVFQSDLSTPLTQRTSQINSSTRSGTVLYRIRSRSFNRRAPPGEEVKRYSTRGRDDATVEL